MIKVEQQIERDIYTLIKKNSLGKAIKGKVYRDEMRPANAQTEDVIVKFLAGLDEQIQTGVVIVNIYVPDILQASGRKVIDQKRILALEECMLEFINGYGDTEYLLTTDSSMTVVYNSDIEQHLINVRLKFKRLSN